MSTNRILISRPPRLVVRGVNWLGDAVMSMPALTRLRAALPDTHITLLTGEKLAELWRGHEAVNEVLTFSKTEAVGSVSRKLRAGRFDCALVLPNSFRSAFEAWLAGIPHRVGYGRPWLLTHRVTPRREHVEMRKRSAAEVHRLVQKQPDKPSDRFPVAGHHLHQYLRLVSAFGASEEPLAPNLSITEPERIAFLNKYGLSREPILGLNPGAEYGPAKRWPIENFIAVARRIPARSIVFGGAGDAANASQIASALPAALNLAGQTSLRELAVGLSLCQVVLTNDTGPMHLAAAVGAAVVVPFGSTSPELTGPGAPGNTKHQVIRGEAPCAPCFLRVCPIDFRCMNAIHVSDVADRVVEAFAGRITITAPAPGSA